MRSVYADVAATLNPVRIPYFQKPFFTPDEVIKRTRRPGDAERRRLHGDYTANDRTKSFSRETMNGARAREKVREQKVRGNFL